MPDANVHAIVAIAMLLPLKGRRIYYDLTGAQGGPVVCMTHSLMSDSGMWSEQMPPHILSAQFIRENRARMP